MWRRWALVLLCTLIWLASSPAVVQAQFWPSLGGRTVSRNGKWVLPVIGGVLSSDEDDHLRRGSVFAWDISMPYGSIIFPMAAGKVSYAGCNNAGGYGCWVLVDHGDGYLSLYGHMIDEGGGQVKIQTGDRVHIWTPLGRIGWTGMTSFGPHVHWEIHNAETGRVRNDFYFSRSAIVYCKFCAADGSAVQEAAAVAFYGGGLVSRELLAGLIVLLLALTLFFRPDAVASGLQKASHLLYTLWSQSQGAWGEIRQRKRLHWVSLLFVFLAPTIICSSGTALAVWMSDERIDPRTIMAYFRYGLYPFPGQGYQVGAHYSAVWGIPCHSVGTLGQVCSADEIAEATVDWQKQVALFSRGTPIPVAIPRLEGKFDLNEARRLLNAMHYINGLMIVDVASDFKAAYEVVDELTGFGLDGIAIDMEFAQTVRQRDLYWLAEHMAKRREEAQLPGRGVLLVWNVFHNLDTSNAFTNKTIATKAPTVVAQATTKPVNPNQANVASVATKATVTSTITSTVASTITVKGSAAQAEALTNDLIEIVPIFTGYGPVETKIAGLVKTQALFAVDRLNSGVMAFDQRWPVNQRCTTFNTTLGFDCQRWPELFAHPIAASAGWWVQQ